METYVVEVSETLIGGNNLTLHSVEYAGPDKEVASEKARECLEKIKRRGNCLYFFVRVSVWNGGEKIGEQFDHYYGRRKNNVTTA